MRIGEVDRDARDLGKPLVWCHLAPLIIGQEEPPLFVNTLEDGAKADNSRYLVRDNPMPGSGRTLQCL